MKDIVTFEIAKKLKDKGFREKCLLHYESTGGIYSNSIDTYDRPNQKLDYSDFLKCYNKGNSLGLIDAPTISQVLKWLRNKECLFLKMEHITKNSVGCKVIRMKTGGVIASYKDDKFRYATKNSLAAITYEECALEAIEYVLDNLI